MNVSIIESVPEAYTGKKHRWLYDQLEKLNKGKTLEIEFESIRELMNHISAVRRMYPKEIGTRQIEMHTRKYKSNGTHTPTLYITRN